MAKKTKKEKKNNIYFGQNEEDLILQYISADTREEKEELYKKVEPIFKKMIESIIRRYKLYVPDESFQEIYDDTFSFLLTKLDKFTPGRSKAYSYYGTIAKNYLIGRVQGFKKEMERNPLYDSVSEEFVNNLKYSYSSEPSNSENIAGEIVSKMSKRISDIIEKEGDTLKESEKKIGMALIDLFDNIDDIMDERGSNKLNKSIILYFLREHTGLDTPMIRSNMKRFKREFLLIKGDIIGL